MKHIELETLSAQLDGETSQAERLSISDHLRDCPVCAEQLAHLTRAQRAIATLPPVSPTPEEQRKIRMLVLERSRTSSSTVPRPRRGLAALWGVAGAVAVVTGLVVFANLGPSNRSEIGSSLSDLDTASVLAFESPEQVRALVESLPEVTSGVKQYRVADVGLQQEQAIVALAPILETSAAPTRKGAKVRGPEVIELPIGADYPRGSDQRCLRSVLQSQRHPTMPLMVRQATFKSAPAWLLVYAWTPDLAEDAPLDRLKYWLVNPSDCATLNYSSSRLG